MSSRAGNDLLLRFERELANPVRREYVLRLYVTGSTVRSMSAIAQVKRVCERYLRGSYKLEIVDLYLNPSRARTDQVVASPTLVKHLPAPARRVVGDPSNWERLLQSLELSHVSPRPDRRP